MNSNAKALLIGAVAGVVLTQIVKTSSFRKGCARVLSAGLQLKSDATQFVETVKEDAEDMTAEAEETKKSAKK
ncbi:MAG: hypothetical protein K6A31_00320 [Fibrobacter sp.]|jgi:hypothetical protein|nr:hypothetical protein [Fibrobacter sp.]